MQIIQIISVIANIFSCIGIIIAILEFHLLKKSTLADNERNQKQATLDFYMNVKDNLYALNHEIYSRYKRKKIEYSEIESDEKFLKTLKDYLNMMEIIATGINTNIYNINVFDRLYGDVCIRVSDQLENYIYHRRIIIGEKEMYRDYDLLVSNLKHIHNKNNEILNAKATIKNLFKIH